MLGHLVFDNILKGHIWVRNEKNNALHLHKGREEVTILALKHLQVKAAQSVSFKVLLIVVPAVELYHGLPELLISAQAIKQINILLVSTRRCRALKRLRRPELTFPGMVVKLDH